jgi:hypothetical protein
MVKYLTQLIASAKCLPDLTSPEQIADWEEDLEWLKQKE